MTKTLLLLSFVIIGSVFGATTTVSSEVRQSLAQLESNEYAKNLLNILQLHRENKASTEEIKALLYTMKQGLLNQQKTEDESNRVISANCESIQSNLNVQVPLYEKTLQDAKKRQTGSQTDESEAKRNLDDTMKQLEATQERRAKGNSTTAEQDALSNDKIQKLKEGIEAIEACIKMVRSPQWPRKRTAAALAELDEKIEKIFSIGTEFSMKNLAFYSGQVRSARDNLLTTTLVETSDKHQRKLVKLLNELEDNFRAALLQEEALQKSSHEHADKLSHDLDEEIRTLQENIAHLNSRIQKSQEEYHETTDTISQISVLLDSSKKSQASYDDECKRAEKHHTDQASRRTGDVEIIDKLIEFFTEKGDSIKQYLKERSI